MNIYRQDDNQQYPSLIQRTNGHWFVPVLVCPYILGELETQVQNLYVYIFRKNFNSHLFLVKFTPGLPQSGPGYA